MGILGFSSILNLRSLDIVFVFVQLLLAATELGKVAGRGLYGLCFFPLWYMLMGNLLKDVQIRKNIQVFCMHDCCKFVSHDSFVD